MLKCITFAGKHVYYHLHKNSCFNNLVDVTEPIKSMENCNPFKCFNILFDNNFDLQQTLLENKPFKELHAANFWNQISYSNCLAIWPYLMLF